MPYYYDETGKQEYTNDEMRGIAYTADGYLLPCCWCDEIKHRKDFVDLGFYNAREYKIRLEFVKSNRFGGGIEVPINWRPKKQIERVRYDIV